MMHGSRRISFVAGVVVLSVLTCAGIADASWPEVMRDDADLHDVVFVNKVCGWAVGDRGAIWHTDDGGLQWTLQSSGVSCPLWSVDFVDEKLGVAVGGKTLPFLHRSQAVVLTTNDGGTTWEHRSNPSVPALFEVQLEDGNHGIAFGATSPLYPRGLFATKDGGRIWGGSPKASNDHQHSDRGQLARLKSDKRLPDAEEFEWKSLAAQESRAWIAGSPGSFVYRTDDGGRNWQRFSTGISLPLSKLHFVDMENGWAVGALGSVLSTRDGGETWHVQRGSQRRQAALFICSRAEVIPFESIVTLAAIEGYRTHLLVVTTQKDARPFVVPPEARLQEAMSSIGAHGATSWAGFETPNDESLSANEVLGHWPEGSVDALAKRLTATIRTWQPDVVFFAQPDSARKTIDDIVGIAVEAAATACADEHYFPKLKTIGGLDAWQIGRLTKMQLNTGSGRPSSQLCLPLGQTCREIAAAAESLVGLEPKAVKTFKMPGRLVGGMHASAGGDARRAPVVVDAADFSQIALEAQRGRQVEALIDRIVSEKAEVQSTQIMGLASQLDHRRSARLLVRLGAKLERVGRWSLANETWRQVERRYGDTDLGPLAWHRLWKHASSEEIKLRSQSFAKLAVNRPQAKVVSLRTTNRDARSVTTSIESLDERIPACFRKDASLEFARLVGLAADRDAQRERLWQKLARTSADEASRRCAQAELALVNPQRTQPKSLITAPVGERPLLDGKLDDATWEAAATIELNALSADRAEDTLIKLSRDAEYLFCAIVAIKSAAADYSRSEQSRERDTDLSNNDRVQILLDVDRDYHTGWTFEVDYRGWGAEHLAYDRDFNPNWLIAQSEDSQSWTVELAIPLAELGSQSVSMPDATWGIAFRRKVPGKVATTWPPESHEFSMWTQLGYLRFAAP